MSIWWRGIGCDARLYRLNYRIIQNSLQHCKPSTRVDVEGLIFTKHPQISLIHHFTILNMLTWF